MKHTNHVTIHGEKIIKLFERFSHLLPSGVVEEGRDLISHGENAIAHELLSQMLFEYSVHLKTRDFFDLQESAILVGIDVVSLEFLRPLVY